MAGEEVLPTSSFRDALDCPICMVVFVDPKQLSCGHTFCAECVDKLVATSEDASTSASRFGLGGSFLGTNIKCPQCRKHTAVPIDGLTTNFVVKGKRRI